MPDTIEQIKSRLDIVDVISGYIKTQKSGVNFKARCPFHNEKTPSFYISPERQIWHCFGCSKGGDVFGFVKEIEGVEFPEALRILAQKAGVQLDTFDPKIRNEKTRLLEICETASKFFEKQMWQSMPGKKALAYLKDRGLTEETIKEFRLGFAPDDWHALGTFLNNCGYAHRELVSAGLAIERDGRHYDRFRSRITFPISDINGQIIGFSGRILDLKNNGSVDAETAKYINTPQTLIYDKSRVLYGLEKAKLNVKQADRCVLVEGNMDAVMSHQAGVRNAVATSGTALTQDHLRLLQRYTTNLDFCFDTDQAGAMATRRGIGLALNQKFSINVIELDDPSCKDPADYVRKYGAKWGEAVTASKPVIQFYFDRSKAGYDHASAESKKLLLSNVAPFVKRLASRVERAHWISQLAAFLRAKESDVDEDIRTIRDDLESYEYQPARIAAAEPARQNMPVDILSEALLSMVLKNPLLLKDQLAVVPNDILDPQIAPIISQIASLSAEKLVIDNILKTVQSDGSYKLEFAYLKSQELWQDFGDPELKNEFQNLTSLMKRRHINAQLAHLEYDIKSAEQEKDQARLAELVRQFTALARELSEIPII
ncbi:MAG: DNA primase [Candidatus Yanofskybacteria bacterium]|nr:DNA primase [Candidatus Yanofskybacteria bacterium]